MYSRRKVAAEPPFGQIKNRGFRGFLLRGIEKVCSEWSLIALSHNLLKTAQGHLAGSCHGDVRPHGELNKGSPAFRTQRGRCAAWMGGRNRTE